MQGRSCKAEGWSFEPLKSALDFWGLKKTLLFPWLSPTISARISFVPGQTSNTPVEFGLKRPWLSFAAINSPDMFGRQTFKAISKPHTRLNCLNHFRARLSQTAIKEKIFNFLAQEGMTRLASFSMHRLHLQLTDGQQFSRPHCKHCPAFDANQTFRVSWEVTTLISHSQLESFRLDLFKQQARVPIKARPAHGLRIFTLQEQVQSTAATMFSLPLFKYYLALELNAWQRI